MNCWRLVQTFAVRDHCDKLQRRIGLLSFQHQLCKILIHAICKATHKTGKSICNGSIDLMFQSGYSHRNRYMVEHSDRVIAVYDGRETGGTAKTIRFTNRMKKELREIPVGEIVLPDHLKPKTK